MSFLKNRVIKFSTKMKIKVTTMDEDLDSICIEQNSTGRQLYELVCRIIGLREIWYFGLSFANKNGISCWLNLDKKIKKQNVPEQDDGSFHFLFLVKFYPENVDEDLIQDSTRHLFFAQIKQSILSMDLYCQPEAAVLLASYAVQATYGDCSEEIELKLDRLLPQSVIEQFDMSSEMWEERIRNWWANNNGLSTEDAELEYLRVAQDLDMFGIQYYPILNQKQTEVFLGVSAHGLGIYELNNRLAPRPFFPWAEITRISFKNQLFTIYVADKSKIKFSAKETSTSPSMQDLCDGAHDLYQLRRKPETLEIQQMKAQAKEQRQKRLADQNRLRKERDHRVQVEMERDRYKAEIAILTEQLTSMQNMIKNAEEANLLIAEKARVSEQEALELSKRASEAEAEVQRVKLSQVKAEENKMALERKVRDAELVASRLMHQDRDGNNVWPGLVVQQPFPYEQNESPAKLFSKDHPPPYGEMPPTNGDSIGKRLFRERDENAINKQHFLAGADGRIVKSYDPVIYRRIKKAEAPQPPPPFSKPVSVNARNSQSTSNLFRVFPSKAERASIQSRSHTELPLSGDVSTRPDGLNSPESRQSFNMEIQNLYAEIEQTKSAYYEKNQDLKDQLLAFRKELDALKRDENQTENDRIFASKFESGFDRMSTFRKSGAGPASKRTRIFEGL